jgi:signal transduction histidine kinase
VLVVDRRLNNEAAIRGRAASARREPVIEAWPHVRDRSRQEQQRAFHRRLEQERWNERRRLERDLHDGVQQHLYALGACLAVAREQAEDHPAAATIDRACRQLAELLSSFRAMIQGVAPPELAQYGLSQALHALIERQTIPTVAHIAGGRAPAAVEHVAYLVACEAMTNIAKHADATRITLATELRDDNLVVAIGDNGIGGADMSRGTGLSGLGDRLRSVGGQLELHSPSGVGTTLRAMIPCA